MASLSVEFQTDGKVRIYRYDNGDTFSVTTNANKLQETMPGAYFDELRMSLATLLDITGGPQIKRIG